MARKVFTQQELDALPRNANGGVDAPRGDYSAIKEFPEFSVFKPKTVFGPGTKFGESCTFPVKSRFPRKCKFDTGCIFGEQCKFENGCRFAPNQVFDSSRFGRKCRFAQGCEFSDCMFGDECSFGERCSFSGSTGLGAFCRVKQGAQFHDEACFGHECEFGASVAFYGAAEFGAQCEFGERCSLHNPLSIGNGSTFAKGCDLTDIAGLGDGVVFAEGCLIDERPLRAGQEFLFYAVTLGRCADDKKALEYPPYFFNTEGGITGYFQGLRFTLDSYRESVHSRYEDEPVMRYAMLSAANQAALLFDCAHEYEQIRVKLPKKIIPAKSGTPVVPGPAVHC